MNVAKEMAGLACTRGKLTDLKAWIMDAVDNPAARACWKIVGEPSHLSAEPDTANMKKNVAKYSARIASQKSTKNASLSPTIKQKQNASSVTNSAAKGSD